MGVRCIDTPVFYYPPALIGAAVAVGIVTIGAATAREPGRVRLGVLLIALGVLVLAVVIVGPPYRTCGQFQIFTPRT